MSLINSGGKKCYVIFVYFFSVLPPPISPLVAIADMERAVINVMKVEIAMMINVCPVVFFTNQFTLIINSQLI
jgi:hypothetical protein